MIGSYILIIELKTDVLLSIGKINKYHFKKGSYVYVGSALNGLENRIKRHLKIHKKKHWHIDYFLEYAKITGIYYKLSKNKDECDIANNFYNEFLSIEGFGCSDCSCKSHLFYVTNNFKHIIKKFEMKKYYDEKT
jgi:Uri superfamily endonuclease